MSVGYRGPSLESWALIVAMPLAQVATMSLPVVVVPLREDIGLSYSELGAVLASFGLARLLVDLPAGAFVQRFNPRPMLLIGLALTFVAALVGVTAGSAWHLALARVVNGGSSAIVQTSILAWLVGRSSAESRGRVMALSEAAFSVVAVTIPVGVGLLASALSWRASFAAGMATTAFATLLVLSWTSAESAAAATGRSSRGDQPTGSPERGWSGLRAGGSLLTIAYIVTFLVFFSRQAVHTLLPLLGGEQIQLSPYEIGIATSLLSLVSIGAILAGGWTGDRIGRRKLVFPGILAMLAGHLGLFLIADAATFFSISAVLGIGFVLSFLPVSLIGDALTAPARPRGIALYRLIADGALLLAPLAVGLAIDRAGFDGAKAGIVIVTLAVLAGALGATMSPAVAFRVTTTRPSRQ